MTHLDSDLLRTFLAICEQGSITAGAQRIGRSQSATSLQIKQLEEIVGAALLNRHGRGVSPTPAGERLLPVARQVTGALDQALATFRNDAIAGRVRLGLSESLAPEVQTALLSTFCTRHPGVELEIHCGLGDGFDTALSRGRLDLALYEVPQVEASHDLVRTDRLVWMTAPSHGAQRRDPLPVAMFDQACWWREAALADLAACGRRSRIVFTSESAGAVRAAVTSGMAVALLNERLGGAQLEALEHLAAPRRSHVVVRRAPGSNRAPVNVLAEALHAAARR